MEVEKDIKVLTTKQLKHQRRKHQRLLMSQLFYDYSKNTSLHGLRYVSQKGLHVIEKLFWLFTICLSLAMCAFLIHNIFIKWKTCPVIVSFSEELVPVGRVPFPSVTICPQMKVKQTIFNYSRETAKYDREYQFIIEKGNAGPEIITKVEKLEDLVQICGEERSAMLNRNITNSTLYEHIQEVSPMKEDVLMECIWRGIEEDCTGMFDTVLTEEGICFNLNSLSADDIFNRENIQREYKYLDAVRKIKGWSLADGYDNKEYESYPRRGRENGAMPDLEVSLVTIVDVQDALCNRVSDGFKIYVQHPMDFPQSSLYYYAALPGQVTSLALKFMQITTSETLKSYPPEQRKCYFPGDKQLRYFKIYSYSNCKIECKANYTFKACNCVKFNMPHEDSRSICTHSKKECIHKAIGTLADEDMVNEMGNCNCLPACNSVRYDAEILKSKYDRKKYETNLYRSFGRANVSVLFESLEFSKIEIYYKEPKFNSMKRSELFGLTDFMANIGGLLGLFLGFSFLSLAEIFYFVTLRTCRTMQKDFKTNNIDEDLEIEK